MEYNFQEIPKPVKKNIGMCSKCRYRFHAEPPFGCGWTACAIMTDHKDNYDVGIYDIPLEVRCNCPGFEKKTLLSFFKKAKPRIIYTDKREVDNGR